MADDRWGALRRGGNSGRANAERRQSDGGDDDGSGGGGRFRFRRRRRRGDGATGVTPPRTPRTPSARTPSSAGGTSRAFADGGRADRTPSRASRARRSSGGSWRSPRSRDTSGAGSGDDGAKAANSPTTQRRARLASSLRQQDRSVWLSQLARLRAHGPSTGSGDADDNGTARNTLVECVTTVAGVLFPSPSISKYECADMVAAMCTAVPVRDAPLVTKVAGLVASLSRHVQITFKPVQLDAVVPFHCRVLQGAQRTDPVSLATLKSLSFVLFANADRCTKFYDDILKVLAPLVHQRQPNLATKHAALVCLSNLIERGGNRSKPLHGSLFATMFAVFAAFCKLPANAENGKVVATCLRAMGKMISESKEVHTVVCGELLRYLRVLLVYGVDTHAMAKAAASPSAAPGTGVGAGTGVGIGAGGASSTKSDGGAKHPRPYMFDSDTSDQEAAGHAMASRRHPTLRARVAALGVLQTVAKVSPKMVQREWVLLLPQSRPMGFDPAAPTLLSCLLYDPAPRAREAAASALGAILDGAPLRKLLPLPTAAQARAPTGGAAPSPPGGSRRRGVATMSDRIASMITCVFVALRRVLQPGVEPVASVLTQCLKTLTTLVHATPFARLEDAALLPLLLVQLRRLLVTREPSVCVAAVVCVGAVLACERMPRLAAELSAAPPATDEGVPSTPLRQSLLHQLLRMADRASHMALRTEALNAIAKAVKQYAPQLSKAWSHVCPSLMAAFRNREANIRGQALKILEELLRWRAAALRAADERGSSGAGAGAGAGAGTGAGAGASASASAGASADTGAGAGTGAGAVQPLDGVLMLATTHVARALRDPAPAVRTSACMCFSYLLPDDLHALPVDQQDRWLRVFAAATKDSTASVRAAACRILGAFACFKEWKMCVFAAVAMPVLLKCLKDSVLSVRVKAAWAWSNLLDTGDSRAIAGSGVAAGPQVADTGARPTSYSSTARSAGSGGAAVAPPLRVRKLLPLRDTVRVCNGLLEAALDHDKVRSSAVRALGAVGRWLLYDDGFPAADEVATELKARRSEAVSAARKPPLTPDGLLRPAALQSADAAGPSARGDGAGSGGVDNAGPRGVGVARVVGFRVPKVLPGDGPGFSRGRGRGRGRAGAATQRALPLMPPTAAPGASDTAAKPPAAPRASAGRHSRRPDGNGDKPSATVVHSIMTTLAKCSTTGSAKSRWSACYAMGAMMEAAGSHGAMPASWSPAVWTALQQCLLQSPNHKVRISAAQAMMVLGHRSAFGDAFASVFESYLTALRTVDDVADFRNFKYKETLRDQVSAALLRAMQLCRRGDFGPMRAFLIQHAQFIYDWLLGMERRATAARASATTTAAAASSSVPTGTILPEHVAAAFENMTMLYESRIQTIPLSLLTKFQDKVFGQQS